MQNPYGVVSSSMSIGALGFTFDQLEQIAIHMLPYVEAMGVKVEKSSE